MRGQRLAETVEDAPALGRRQGELDMVVFGGGLVFLALQDLELEQARHQAGPDDTARPRRKDHAAAEIILDAALGFHVVCPTGWPGARPRSNILCAIA